MVLGSLRAEQVGELERVAATGLGFAEEPVGAQFVRGDAEAAALVAWMWLRWTGPRPSAVLWLISRRGLAVVGQRVRRACSQVRRCPGGEHLQRPTRSPEMRPRRPLPRQLPRPPIPVITQPSPSAEPSASAQPSPLSSARFDSAIASVRASY